MGTIRNLIGYLCNNPKKIIQIATARWQILPEKWQLRMMYYLQTGEKLNLENPQTYNEKLQWLKMYDRKPVYSTMVDKYRVKDYVAGIVGSQYVIPLLGVWDRTKDIDLATLPNQFVLKVTHGGGGSGVFVCKDKSKFDAQAVFARIEKFLRIDGYKANCEWPYKNVPHQIIAEEYMEDKVYGELRDYKFFCFNGEPKIMFVASDRYKKAEPNFDFFDMDFNHLDLRSQHPTSDTPPPKPETFEEMKEVARKLAKGLPQIRIDLYEVNGRVYFGEFTFFHWGGYGKFYPHEWEKKLGDWIVLPKQID